MGTRKAGSRSRDVGRTQVSNVETTGRQVPVPAILSAESAPAPVAVLDALDARLENSDAVEVPRCESFAQFLLEQARVPVGGGHHGPYTFAGRESLREIVNILDRILGAYGWQPVKDATVTIAGGAQFGKTILELNLIAYLTGIHFRNAGLFLPDDDLVEGVVDAKFRPDVLDQIEWFAAMTKVGKALNKSGKAVNRKGAFLVTDGTRKAVGMVRGLGKVPTTFSVDLAALDEVDDIQPKMLKFVRGRMTASDLRLFVQIGTQRVHGRGMNKAWTDGSQGVIHLTCPKCGLQTNPEDKFPQVVRLVVQASACPSANPQLTWAGDFKRAGEETVCAQHAPENEYYLGCPDCGEPLPRDKAQWFHRRPDRIRLNNYSFRVSQLGIGAIDLSQIVAHWIRAVADSEEMVAFRCDALALPLSTGQALTPEIIKRARGKHDLRAIVSPGCAGFAGLDMGDQCWFLGHELDPKTRARRVIAAEKIAAANVVSRVQNLFMRLGLTALFIDERPAVNEARTLALILNGLNTLTTWPKPPAKDGWVQFPALPSAIGHQPLTWNGREQRWENLRCAVVRFSKHNLGAGIEHTWVEFEDGGQTKFVPCIACNRFETIDWAVRKYLTPAENVVEIVNGAVRETPATILPQRPTGAPLILETLESHLVTGSEREKETDGSLGDYVDGCDNHLLLADAYSGLAQRLVGERTPTKLGGILRPRGLRAQAIATRHERSLPG